MQKLQLKSELLTTTNDKGFCVSSQCRGCLSLCISIYNLSKVSYIE